MIITVAPGVALAAPVIDSFSPATLAGSGQALSNVTISGSNFVPGSTTVTVDGTTRSVSSVTTTQIVASFAPLSPGTYPVVVTTPGGSATANYTYTTPGPTIDSVSPSQGTTGTAITIYGTNLSGGSVSIGGVGVSTTGKTGNALSFTCPSFAVDQTITITVTTTGGSASIAFAYFTPRSATTTTYTSGSGSYTIPSWCNYIDVICVGGGASGDGGQPPAGNANRKGGNAGSWGGGTLSRDSIGWGTTNLSYSVGAGAVFPPYDAANPNTTGSKAVTQPGSPSSAGGVTGSGGSGNTSNMAGGSAGNYTYNGVTYIGGVGADRSAGTAPGSGGGAAQSSGSGFSGQPGQVWFVARQ